MKSKCVLICAILLLSMKTFSQTNLRGQVITYYYGQQMPYVSAKVDLYIFDPRMPVSNQWRLMGSTITDAYGFYFFRGVYPGPYTIWVNQAKSYNIQVIPIDYRYVSYQDLPQFIF